MKVSKRGIELIKQFEGFRPKPYLCEAGVTTIGWGTTKYMNGSRVKMTDGPISMPFADEQLRFSIEYFEREVDAITTDKVTQNQFDALVSFAYNLGVSALRKSTLLKKVNANPNDVTIPAEFERWVYADGKKSNGLLKRRKEESKLYTTK